MTPKENFQEIGKLRRRVRRLEKAVLTVSGLLGTERWGRLQDLARYHGYALAVHGSLARDLDIVAVPWVEEASSADDLATALRDAVGGVFAATRDGNPQPEGTRPHGRRSWAIQSVQLPVYIDLSVMPRLD